MKKILIRIVVLIVVFFTTVFITEKRINQGHENITKEMSPASFPTLTFVWEDYDYNTLYAYAEPMEIAYQRESLTILGEERETDFSMHTYGRSISGLTIEVRNVSDMRLIEQSPVIEYIQQGDRVTGTLQLKDLISGGTEYSLCIIAEVDESAQVYYYTRVLWEEDVEIGDKLGYVKDFHDRLFDKEKARELTKYLETNSAKESNSTLAEVNIYSSFKQVTYGDLAPWQVGEERIRLVENSGLNAAFMVEYLLSSGNSEEPMLYLAKEFYRIRNTKDRVYLLNYQRHMEQIPQPENMAVNDKLALGITSEEVNMSESEDGNTLAFVSAGTLYCYNANKNRLARVFGFYDTGETDDRLLNQAHDIRILGVDEAGNVDFAVYGYMNRGRHEGEVGVELYTYDGTLNTIEEIVYLPYEKSWQILEEELGRLLYLNKDRHLYLTLEDEVYCIDLENRQLLENNWQISNEDDTLRSSVDHRLLVSTQQTGVDNRQMTILNLSTEKDITISSDEGDLLKFLGFIDEDLVYGLAHQDDVYRESSGQIFYPMYKVCICNESGKLLKNYEQEGVYITDCTIRDNQILLTRVQKQENGEFKELAEDSITTSGVVVSKRNKIAAADIEIYQHYIQIQTQQNINTKSLKVVTPKEVVYEGGRTLEIIPERAQRYYLYDGYGICGIYHSPGNAVDQANERIATSGTVIAENGVLIWKRGDRSARNQIMAISAVAETEEKNSVAICLDSMLAYEGVVRNSEYLMGKGQEVMEILEQNLPDVLILNLEGAPLDAVLYYIWQEIPVLAFRADGSAVLLTGYNDSSVILMDPRAGTLEKMSLSDAALLFQKSGNAFISYVYRNEEQE